MPVTKMVHKTDPRDEIYAKVGDLKDCDVFHNQILLAIYQRPDAMDLGGGKKLYISDKTRGEDKFQGVVGLVLKAGPLALKGEEFAGQIIERGDWVVFRPSDGWSLEVHGVNCRMLHDTDLKLRVQRPDYVY